MITLCLMFNGMYQFRNSTLLVCKSQVQVNEQVGIESLTEAGDSAILIQMCPIVHENVRQFSICICRVSL